METATPCADEDEILGSMNIDLDDEFVPRTLAECEQGLPPAIEVCRAVADFDSCVEVCDFCRSLLAAHLRERGDAETVRALLERALIVVSAAREHLPADKEEQVAHFIENIKFRIDVVETLGESGEAAAQRLINERQVMLANRLIA